MTIKKTTTKTTKTAPPPPREPRQVPQKYWCRASMRDPSAAPRYQISRLVPAYYTCHEAHLTAAAEEIRRALLEHCDMDPEFRQTVY